MYTRAVWKEGDLEEDGVVPDNWIDRNKRTVRWPRNMSTTKTERALRDKINPQDDWMTFPLIKIKMTSAKRRECDNYNLTSQAEEDGDDDDDDEVPIRSTRNRTKKGTPEGFVRNELTDSDEESIRGIKQPNYPTAPRKLPSIQDTNMDHNASSGDEAMSVQEERADSSRGSEISTPPYADGALFVQAERADSSRGSGMSTPYSGSRASSHPVKPAGRSLGRERNTSHSVNQTLDDFEKAFSSPENRAAGSLCREMSDLSGLVERASGFHGREASTPCPQDASTAPRHRDLSRPRSRHAARGYARDGYCTSGGSSVRSRHNDGSSFRFRHSDVSRSRHSDDLRRKVRSRSRSRDSDESRRKVRSRSRHSDDSRRKVRSRSRSHHSDGSRHIFRSRHDGSHHSDAYRCDDRPPARSRHNERSPPSDLTSPPYDRPRHDAVIENGRWTFPLPWDVYQKKVLNLLVDLRNQHKQAQPASSAVHIERMETMEDFKREEQCLCDAQAFDALVLQIARIGGKNTKDCVHKVLDRLFTNALMANFNMKGKGKKSKKPLEGTNVYRAIQDGVMKFDVTATEGFIRMCASEHLKHEPQRCGGGGHTAVSQD